MRGNLKTMDDPGWEEYKILQNKIDRIAEKTWIQEYSDE